MSNQDILKNIIGEMTGTTPTATVGTLIKQLEFVSQYLSNLEQGVVKMSMMVQRLSLMNNLFQDILISKGVLTKEELDELYKKNVYEPMVQQADQLKQKVSEMQKQEQKVTEVKKQDEHNCEECNGSCKVNEPSDVILPSEVHKPVVFK